MLLHMAPSVDSQVQIPEPLSTRPKSQILKHECYILLTLLGTNLISGSQYPETQQRWSSAVEALITSEYWSLVSRPGVFIGFYKIAGQVRGQWIDWWMVSSRGGSVTYAKYSWKRVGEDVSCWPMWLFFVQLFDVQAPFNLQSATAEIFQWWPVSRGTLGVNSLPSLYLPRCSTATPSPPLASRVRGQPQPM